MMTLDTRRHDARFDKKSFNLPVHVIGLGGVGSHVARLIAKLGIGTQEVIYLWDGDTVEAHNLSNQAYRTADIGKKKAFALVRHVYDWSGDSARVLSYPQYVRGTVRLSGIVFLCLDSMQARKDICESSVWRNREVALLIETRMDASYVIIHTLDPNNEKHIERWDQYWFPDERAENEAGCGGHIAIPTTVETTAALAVQNLIDYASLRSLREIPNEFHFNMRTRQSKTSFWE